MWHVLWVFLPIFILLGVAAVVLPLFKKKLEVFLENLFRGSTSVDDAVKRYASVYEKQNSLFSPQETSFLKALDQAIGDKYRIFGKVRLADIVTSRYGISRESARAAFNHVSAKHLDFLLCDKETLEPLCAIEINDSSHSRPDRQARDEFVDNLLRAVSLPLVRIPGRSRYSSAEVGPKILAAVNRSD
jgi:hypothetical protein